MIREDLLVCLKSKILRSERLMCGFALLQEPGAQRRIVGPGNNLGVADKAIDKSTAITGHLADGRSELVLCTISGKVLRYVESSVQEYRQALHVSEPSVTEDGTSTPQGLTRLSSEELSSTNIENSASSISTDPDEDKYSIRKHEEPTLRVSTNLSNKEPLFTRDEEPNPLVPTDLSMRGSPILRDKEMTFRVSTDRSKGEGEPPATRDEGLSPQASIDVSIMESPVVREEEATFRVSTEISKVKGEPPITTHEKSTSRGSTDLFADESSVTEVGKLTSELSSPQVTDESPITWNKKAASQILTQIYRLMKTWLRPGPRLGHVRITWTCVSTFYSIPILDLTSFFLARVVAKKCTPMSKNRVQAVHDLCKPDFVLAPPRQPCIAVSNHPRRPHFNDQALIP